MTRFRKESRAWCYDSHTDPEAERHALPTYGWEAAPVGLLTRRQLRARGLCPGGQAPVALLMWHRRRKGCTFAYLYDINHARTKRTATPAVLAAIGRALLARTVCGSCGLPQTYFIPRTLGQCLDCAGYPAAAA